MVGLLPRTPSKERVSGIQQPPLRFKYASPPQCPPQDGVPLVPRTPDQPSPLSPVKRPCARASQRLAMEAHGEPEASNPAAIKAPPRRGVGEVMAFAALGAALFFGAGKSVCRSPGERPTISLDGFECSPCPRGQYKGSWVRLLLPSPPPSSSLPEIEMRIVMTANACSHCGKFNAGHVLQRVRSGDVRPQLREHAMHDLPRRHAARTAPPSPRICHPSSTQRHPEAQIAFLRWCKPRARAILTHRPLLPRSRHALGRRGARVQHLPRRIHPGHPRSLPPLPLCAPLSNARS